MSALSVTIYALLASSPSVFAGEHRVVGGEEAPEGRWPDAAAIWSGREVGCTGTLIAPDVVLTAGHCDDGITAVTVDAVDYRAEDAVRVAVREVVAYPDWEWTYDLALVFLEEPVDVIPRTIAQDCVIDQALSAGAQVAVVGYGAVDVWGYDYRTTLQQAATSVMDPDCTDLSLGCMEEVSPSGELTAGGDGVDACFGDSGGPLYLLTDEGAFLVGVTSRGYDTSYLPCSEGGIYVRPDAVMDWIEETIGYALAAPECAGSGAADGEDEACPSGDAGDEGDVEVEVASDPSQMSTLHYEISTCSTAGRGGASGLLALVGLASAARRRRVQWGALLRRGCNAG